MKLQPSGPRKPFRPAWQGSAPFAGADVTRIGPMHVTRACATIAAVITKLMGSSSIAMLLRQITVCLAELVRSAEVTNRADLQSIRELLEARRHEWATRQAAMTEEQRSLVGFEQRANQLEESFAGIKTHFSDLITSATHILHSRMCTIVRDFADGEAVTMLDILRRDPKQRSWRADVLPLREQMQAAYVASFGAASDFAPSSSSSIHVKLSSRPSFRYAATAGRCRLGPPLARHRSPRHRKWRSISAHLVSTVVCRARATSRTRRHLRTYRERLPQARGRLCSIGGAAPSRVDYSCMDQCDQHGSHDRHRAPQSTRNAVRLLTPADDHACPGRADQPSAPRVHAQQDAVRPAQELTYVLDVVCSPAEIRFCVSGRPATIALRANASNACARQRAPPQKRASSCSRIQQRQDGTRQCDRRRAGAGGIARRAHRTSNGGDARHSTIPRRRDESPQACAPSLAG